MFMTDIYRLRTMEATYVAKMLEEKFQALGIDMVDVHENGLIVSVECSYPVNEDCRSALQNLTKSLIEYFVKI